MDQKPLSPDEEFARREKGRKNEERFRHLLSNPLTTPAWISKVEHANEPDDFEEGIDFYVYTTTGWKIPVDIKSSVGYMRGRVAKRGDKSACLIVIHDHYSDEVMLKRIVHFLHEFQEKTMRWGIDEKFRLYKHPG